MAAPVAMSPLPRIIGLTGHAQNGKDTIATILTVAGYERVGFADQLKDLALRVNPHILQDWNGDGVIVQRLSEMVANEGWEGAKKEPEVRRFLQELGNNAREVLGEDVWIGALARRVAAYSPYRRLVISDVRYLNEGDWVRRMHGEVWRVTRFVNGEQHYAISPDHASERDIPAMRADVEVVNDGTLEDLQRKLQKYVTDRALMAAVAR